MATKKKTTKKKDAKPETPSGLCDRTVRLPVMIADLLDHLVGMHGSKDDHTGVTAAIGAAILALAEADPALRVRCMVRSLGEMIKASGRDPAFAEALLAAQGPIPLPDDLSTP